MPKFPTFPYLFDEGKNISTSKLREWGYLKWGTFKNSTVTWSRNGIETSSVGIFVNINDTDSFLRVNYKCNDTDYQYKIPLVHLPSNLGKGVIWYFLCPFTGKRCRKLHLIDERFMHRTALPSGMYECQTWSKQNRSLFKLYEKMFVPDEVYRERYSKYFKTHYAGKPTKRFLRLQRKIEVSEQYSQEDREKLYLI